MLFWRQRVLFFVEAARILRGMHALNSVPSKPLNRRRAIRCSYGNAGLWGIGNGLVSTTLVLYLANSFGATSLAVSLIIASPRFVGLFRLAAPALLERLGDRRRFCLLTYIASSLVLLSLPAIIGWRGPHNPHSSLAILIILWTAYHLLEYFGTISLWSWLADLVPPPIRGRFVGRRQRWLVGGRLIGMIVSGSFTYQWTATLPAAHPDRWIAYAISACAGACVMAIAVLPLAWMPNVPTAAPKAHGFRWRRLWRVVVDRDYRRLITFSCWFGFFNGLTQAAQFIYPSRVLGFEYFEWLALRSGLRAGQTMVSPALGRCVDRLGNIPVMLACQALVASGPLFFLLATPSARWWIAVAYVVWIAYAGLNIGLPNLMLGLSPRSSDTSYIAVYFAASELCYGLGTVLGGLLLDRLRQQGVTISIESVVFDAFGIMFLIGLATRAIGVLLVARIREPDDHG